MLQGMPRTIPFKRRLLATLLDFCYPDVPPFDLAAPPVDFNFRDFAELFESKGKAAEYVADLSRKLSSELKTLQKDKFSGYRDIEALRGAVTKALRDHIGDRDPDDDSLSILNRVVNEPIRLVSTISPNSRIGITVFDDPAFHARNIVQVLLQYLDEPGDDAATVCEQCDKLFMRTKASQRFCSAKCRSDFWNSQKMKEYFQKKAKVSRAHKKRIKDMKGDKRP